MSSVLKWQSYISPGLGNLNLYGQDRTLISSQAKQNPLTGHRTSTDIPTAEDPSHATGWWEEDVFNREVERPRDIFPLNRYPQRGS